MSLQSIILKSAIVLSVALVAFVGFSQGSQIAEAQEKPTVRLYVTTMDGVEIPGGVVIGLSEVKLAWTITGVVTDCSISPGVGSVPPVSGWMKVEPTSGTPTTYKITCNETPGDGPIENTEKPEVTMDIKQGRDLTIDPLRGYVERVEVTWESKNADQCGLVWRVKDSAPGERITETNSSEYYYQYYRFGSIRYDGNPRSISESTTFYITCTNANGPTTASVKLNVSNPKPPSPPSLELWTKTSTVIQDELYGWATAHVAYDAENVTWCKQEALDSEGKKYKDNPSGWDNSPKTKYDNANILLGETTTFIVTCGRDAFVFDGKSYEKEEVTKRVTVVVKPPPTVPPGEDWDREDLPPVKVTITANPELASKDPTDELARSLITIHSENADHCKLKAFYLDKDKDKDEDDEDGKDKEYELAGWSGYTIGGNTNWSKTVVLQDPTRLEVDCRREYDLKYGDDDEKENGQDIASAEVEISDTYTTLPEPVVYLYGNAVVMSAEDIGDSETDMYGWSTIDDGPPITLSTQGSHERTNRVSFPFVHPYGASDKYDIHFQYCDEDDGVADFRFYVKGTEVGGLTTDRYSVDDGCNQSTTFIDLIASDITIKNGDEITIECDSRKDGERCRFSNVYFGAGGNGAGVSTGANADSVNLLWLSRNTTRCESFVATDEDGSGPWGPGGASLIFGESTESVSKDTTFEISCGRNSDGVYIPASLSVLVPTSTEISASINLQPGECIDPATGLPVNWGSGWGPGPDGVCVALVDLVAVASSPQVTEDDFDRINGTYNKVTLKMGMKNIGPGDLPDLPNAPDDERVVYLGNITNITFPLISKRTTEQGRFNGPLASSVQSGLLQPTPLEDVQFGTSTVCARVNLDGSPNNFPENSASTTNNTDCVTVFFPPPPPPMSITATPNIIRKNEKVTIAWSAETSYPLECIVRGAGGVTDNFWANKHYPHPAKPYTGDKELTSLTSTSEFILQCKEPKTETVFEKKVRVEVIPDSYEI